jgi:hypothetical protein
MYEVFTWPWTLWAKKQGEDYVWAYCEKDDVDTFNAVGHPWYKVKGAFWLKHNLLFRFYNASGDPNSFKFPLDTFVPERLKPDMKVSECWGFIPGWTFDLEYPVNCIQGMLVSKGPHACFGPSIAESVDAPNVIHEEPSRVAKTGFFGKTCFLASLPTTAEAASVTVNSTGQSNLQEVLRLQTVRSLVYSITIVFTT